MDNFFDIIESYLNVNRRLHYDKVLERALLIPFEPEHKDKLYKLHERLFKLLRQETISNYSKRYARLYCIVTKYIKEYDLPLQFNYLEEH
jgi:hypothetical protein